MAKKKPTNKKIVKKKAPRLETKEKDLNFVIQLRDPKTIRKDVLEALREIIIFMQGYEAFKRVQEEKIETFTQLHQDVKALNNLINNKLKKLLPKGKLKDLVPVANKKESVEQPAPMMKPQQEIAPPSHNVEEPSPEEKNVSELDDLEHQLADIENRLKSV